MAIHKTAIVAKGAEVDPSVEIAQNVTIEDDVRIGPNVRIMTNAYICAGTDIGAGTVIHMGAVIGHIPQDYAYKGQKTFTRIGKNNIIREYVTIHRGTKEGTATVVGDNNMLMVQSHLGHNCRIADNVVIANGALLAGYVSVDEGAFISGNVVFHQFCRVGRYAMIGGFSGINKDVPPYMNVRGPSIARGVNLVGLRRAGFKVDAVREIKDAFKTLYLSDKSQEDALKEIKERGTSDAIEHLVRFIEESKRGICRTRDSNVLDDFFE